MHRACLFLSLVACFAVAACTAVSGRRTAGTGDIAFRLVWDGQSDLDLYVEDPAATCIFFGQRDSTTGGLLDVDCNAGSDRVCEHPVENVYWPTGTAPAGTYLYWVEAHSLIPAEAPLRFELQLLRGPDLMWRHAGTLEETQQIVGPFQIAFATDRPPAPRPVDRQLPECPLYRPGKDVPEVRYRP
ncbi:MAG TPA: hypothetical protein VH394_17765 [Thermoanaerobaculia bacterium]|jgi:hypothetical protein|nr:hypothetical protein [Thermoanaerobaculia bacterium]